MRVVINSMRVVINSMRVISRKPDSHVHYCRYGSVFMSMRTGRYEYGLNIHEFSYLSCECHVIDLANRHTGTRYMFNMPCMNYHCIILAKLSLKLINTS